MKRLALTAAFVFLAAQSQASILTFDSAATPGVSLGGSMMWFGTGGGHLCCGNYTIDSSISFSGSTYVNDFQMNAMAWEGYTAGLGWTMDINAYNSSAETLWSTTVDLHNYKDWDDWLTVHVGVADVSKITFFSAQSSNGSQFWPSVDNVRINEQNTVPEPTTLIIWLLLGTVATTIGWWRRRKAV
jgi:hypothetical protein